MGLKTNLRSRCFRFVFSSHLQITNRVYVSVSNCREQEVHGGRADYVMA